MQGSFGSVGDALDNALMESTIGLYKTELIDLDPTRRWPGRRRGRARDRRVGPVVQRGAPALLDRLPATCGIRAAVSFQPGGRTTRRLIQQTPPTKPGRFSSTKMSGG